MAVLAPSTSRVSPALRVACIRGLEMLTLQNLRRAMRHHISEPQIRTESCHEDLQPSAIRCIFVTRAKGTVKQSRALHTSRALEGKRSSPCTYLATCNTWLLPAGHQMRTTCCPHIFKGGDEVRRNRSDQLQGSLCSAASQLTAAMRSAGPLDVHAPAERAFVRSARTEAKKMVHGWQMPDC